MLAWYTQAGTTHENICDIIRAADVVGAMSPVDPTAGTGARAVEEVGIVVCIVSIVDAGVPMGTHTRPTVGRVVGIRPCVR